jgi:DNA-directed RNA polymerase specialized sigma24 family protein
VVARRRGGERPDHTLRPTELVSKHSCAWRHRARRHRGPRPLPSAGGTHDAAHPRQAQDRAAGGSLEAVTLSDDAQAIPAYDIIDLDRALEKLARLSERRRTSSVRFIAGLTVEEVAAELGVSPRTIKGDTRVALAWLRREME